MCRKFKKMINHASPNHYTNGKYHLEQCWNCNSIKKEPEPPKGKCSFCGWDFNYVKKAINNVHGVAV